MGRSRWKVPVIGASTSSMIGLLWGKLIWDIRRAKNGPRPYQHPHQVDGPVNGTTSHRILFIGDSLAAGLGANTPETTLPVQVTTLLGGADLKVVAVPGATIEHVVTHQVPQLNALRAAGWNPNLIIISAGANDVAALTSIRRFRRHYQQLLTATVGHPTVVLSIPDLGMADRLGQPLRTVAATRARMLDRALTRILKSWDHTIRVDVRSLPEGMRRRQARQLLCEDRFHPGDGGYQVWADRIVAACADLIPAAAAPLIP